MKRRQLDEVTKKQQIALIKQKILNLSNELLREQAYYKSFNFKRGYNKIDHPSSDASNEKYKNTISRYREKWREISKKARVNFLKANQAAFLIQTVWKQVNGISDSDFIPPDLRNYFQLNLSDYQKAELLVCHQISDNILSNSIQRILFEKEDEDLPEFEGDIQYEIEEEEEDYGN